MRFFQKSFRILFFVASFLVIGGLIFFSQLSQTNAQVDEADHQENIEQLELLTDLFTSQFSEEDARDVTNAMVDVQGIALHKMAAIEDFSNRIPLFSGESGGTRFGVDEPLLRAVVAEVLLRLAELGNLPDYQTDLSGAIELNDVEPGIWFEQSMKIAVQNGVFIPKAGEVRPSDTVNWAELVTIIRRFLGFKALDPEETILVYVKSREWFAAEFYALYRLGILPEAAYQPVNQPSKTDFVQLLYYAIGKASVFSPQEMDSDVFSCTDLGSFSAVKYSPSEFCTMTYAENKQNIEPCDNLTGAEAKQECYRLVGIALGDIGICEDAGTECNAEVAAKTGDITLCDNYEGYKREICIRDVAEANEDHSLCSQLEIGDYEQECYAKVGRATLRTDLCDKSVARFRDDCLLHVAKEKRDPEICYKLPTEESRDACLSKLAAIMMDLSVCERITGNSDSCYRLMARLLEDISICDRFSDEYYRLDCREEVQPTNCDQMSMLCDLNINENYCYTLQDADTKADCFWAYAVDFKNDRRECQKVEHADKQLDCYHSFDTLSEIRNSCANLKDLALRLTCFKYLK